MRRLAFILAFAFGIAVVSVWALQPRPDADAGRSFLGGSQRLAHPANYVAAGNSRLSIARAHDRAITYRVALEVETRPTDGGDGATVQVAGTLLAIGAAPDERSRTRIRYTLAGEARTVHGPLPMAGLTDAFDAYYDSAGHLAGIAWADSIEPRTRNTLAVLAAQLQLAGGAGEKWETSERDALGTYRARYTRTGDGLVRQKLVYTVSADPGLQATALHGETRIVLGDDGWPRDLASEERLTLGVEHAQLVVTTRLELVLVGAEAASAPVPLEAALVDVDALARDRQVEAEADRELVDGASLADLLASRATVVDDQRAAGYQYLRIAALFRLDATATVEAGRRLRATASADEVRVLAGALGDAATPEAQQALGSVATDRALDGERRGQAVVSLGLTPAPTRASLAALRAVVAGPPGELADAAWLALGNLALRLRVTDPAAAAQVVDDILAALRTATVGGDEARALVLVRALGNTGDVRSVDALAPLAASPREELRAAALASLRLIADARSTRLLVAGLLDRDASVRAAAVYAIGFHPPVALAAALIGAYPREQVADVRREILIVAAAHADALPAYRALLERAARLDPDDELRELAARALADT